MPFFSSLLYAGFRIKARYASAFHGLASIIKATAEGGFMKLFWFERIWVAHDFNISLAFELCVAGKLKGFSCILACFLRIRIGIIQLQDALET